MRHTVLYSGKCCIPSQNCMWPTWQLGNSGRIFREQHNYTKLCVIWKQLVGSSKKISCRENWWECAVFKGIVFTNFFKTRQFFLSHCQDMSKGKYSVRSGHFCQISCFWVLYILHQYFLEQISFWAKILDQGKEGTAPYTNLTQVPPPPPEGNRCIYVFF